MKKTMTLSGVVAIGIGSMLGAGIFALLGQVILLAGDKIYLTFIGAGIIAMLSGYSYAKLAQVYPQSGGITEYFQHAFENRFWVGLFSGIYLATLCVSIAMLGKSFGIYVEHLFGGGAEQGVMFAVLAIVFLGLFNMLGRNIGKLEIVLVAIKLSILFVLIALALYHFFVLDRPLQPWPLPQTTGFWKSMSLAFFAYAGYGVMTNTAGDTKDPQRTIPLAIFIAISGIIVLYLMLAFVVVTYAPLADLKLDVNVAISVASQTVMGKQGELFITIAALIAILSGINALLYSSYKIMAKMTQNRELPSFLNFKLIGNATIGMILIVASMAYAAVKFHFSSIATLASTAFLVSYLAVFVAHLLLFKKTDAFLLPILLGILSMGAVLVLSLV